MDCIHPPSFSYAAAKQVCLLVHFPRSSPSWWSLVGKSMWQFDWLLSMWPIHFIYLSDGLSVYLSACLSICPFDSLSICVFICLSVCLYVCLSIYPSVYLSVCLSVHFHHSSSSWWSLVEKCMWQFDWQLSMWPIDFIYLCIKLSACLSIHLSVCTSVCLYLCSS